MSSRFFNLKDLKNTLGLGMCDEERNAFRATIHSMGTFITKQDQKIVGLMQQVATITAQHQAAQHQAAQAEENCRRGVEGAEAQRDQARARVLACEGIIQRLEEQICGLTEERDAALARATEAEEALDRIHKILDGKNRLLTELVQDGRAKDAAHAKTRARLARVEDEATRSADAEAEARRKARLLQKKLNKLEKEGRRTKKTYLPKLDKLLDKIRMQEARAARRGAERDQAVEEAARLRAEMATLTSDHRGELQTERELGNFKLQREQAQVRNLYSVNAGQAARIAQLEAENAWLHQENAALTDTASGGQAEEEEAQETVQQEQQHEEEELGFNISNVKTEALAHDEEASDDEATLPPPSPLLFPYFPAFQPEPPAVTTKAPMRKRGREEDFPIKREEDAMEEGHDDHLPTSAKRTRRH